MAIEELGPSQARTTASEVRAGNARAENWANCDQASAVATTQPALAMLPAAAKIQQNATEIVFFQQHEASLEEYSFTVTNIQSTTK